MGVLPATEGHGTPASCVPEAWSVLANTDSTKWSEEWPVMPKHAKTCTGAELTRVVVEWGYPLIGGLCSSKVVFMNVYWPVRWSAIRKLFHAACRIAKSGAINHADLGSIFLCLNLLAMAANDNMLHSSIHLGTSKLLQLFGEFGGNCSPETLERASYWQVPKRKWYHGWRVPRAIHNKGTLNLTWALQHSLFWVRQDWWLFHFRESLRKMKADTCNSRGLCAWKSFQTSHARSKHLPILKLLRLIGPGDEENLSAASFDTP